MNLVGFSEPDLVKYCDEGFNPTLSCNSIRIGTLYGFRAEENEKLRDEGEGEFELNIKFPKLTAVSKNWISEVGFDGGGSATIDHLQFRNGEVILSGASLKGSAHNCWIYCMTAKSHGSVGSISEAHNSSWVLPAKNVQAFGGHIMNLLFDSIQVTDYPKHLRSVPVRELAAKTQISASIRRIDYMPRDILIESEADFPVEKLRELKASIPFIKPPLFKDEAEVRFAFWLTYENEVISVEDNPKILNLRPIDRLIDGKKA